MFFKNKIELRFYINLGVGFAKNQAVRISTGRYLCFCDADDVNFTSRLQDQFDAANTLLKSTSNSFVLLGIYFFLLGYTWTV